MMFRALLCYKPLVIPFDSDSSDHLNCFSLISHIVCLTWFTQSIYLLPLFHWKKWNKVLPFLQNEKDMTHPLIQLFLQWVLLLRIHFFHLAEWLCFKANMRFIVTFRIKPVKYWQAASVSIQHHCVRLVIWLSCAQSVLYEFVLHFVYWNIKPTSYTILSAPQHGSHVLSLSSCF